jgi:drug/metabolite transporter (DMT)-like permease
MDVSALGVVFGLLTAVGFGLSDFAVTLASRRVGPLRSLYLIQAVGLVFLLALAAILGDGLPGWSGSWLWMIALGVFDFAGMYLLYRAFTVGSLSIVSPIAASYAVVTGLIALAAGERPPGLVLLGTAVLVGGVIVVSRGSGGHRGGAGLAGVPEALLAALFLGVYFWAMDGLTAEWGWLWPVSINRAVQLICAFAVLAWSGQRVSLKPEAQTGWLLVAAGVVETAALLSFNLGVERAYTTVTTALGSLYSAVAVVLAWLFLRERLRPAQWVGILTILSGVLLVSL